MVGVENVMLSPLVASEVDGIPVQAAITAAGASTLIGIPVAIVVSAALDKIIAPAFGRGDYAKYLAQAKFYQSITDMNQCSAGQKRGV